MDFWQKITGSDITREFKAFEARARRLPAEYQAAWETIKTYLWPHTDFTGRNLVCYRIR